MSPRMRRHLPQRRAIQPASSTVPTLADDRRNSVDEPMALARSDHVHPHRYEIVIVIVMERENVPGSNAEFA